ncbi:unnamed protein product [Linum tenue]|uniref:Uncharacterized protein n=1 Tax=Linum tenue TaxID=586396 RepID=A0AAV0J8H4_9ROSI|nr:unnamed protein product [Linum tenue]
MKNRGVSEHLLKRKRETFLTNAVVYYLSVIGYFKYQ